ncbi:MarR family winged helix-turn-helix transcriptional regulator [Mesorhizobium sp. CO1-1-8]|uniref:MarR family winged helix-turn-helix transcriptional regulator n=1 Tax=Mesorhizobium sp. CO1-1-8 TaxID=2876631 RepID=UPI001CD168C8|nr:MarR family transcriptional regulator [Mesorhizobium sp. CO1-1-8]MBZ9775022.1 MarR family transcriptional regulator [Mesorhizobium sp. CO1-1-8]
MLAIRLGILITTELDEFFRPWGITALQFNVLRILYVRDPDRQGISRGEMEASLVRKVPDVTRLLDRLVAAGLIARHRPKDNQRTVLATLTDKGWGLIEQTHGDLMRTNHNQFAGMSAQEVAEFVGLLRKAARRPQQTKNSEGEN